MIMCINRYNKKNKSRLICVSSIRLIRPIDMLTCPQQSDVHSKGFTTLFYYDILVIFILL